MYGAKHSTNPLFQQLRVLKCLDIIELQTALFMYKAYYSCLPSNIQHIFVKRETTYSLRACHDLERIRVHSTNDIEIDECLRIWSAIVEFSE